MPGLFDFDGIQQKAQGLLDGLVPQGSDVANTAMRALGVGAPARTYLDALSGRKKPVSAADFTPDEMDAMRQLIATAQAAQRRRLEQFQAAGASPEQRAKGDKIRRQMAVGAGSVTYDPYYEVYETGSKNAAAADKIRHSLGRFNFSQTPDGGFEVADNYDFDNEFRHADVEKYQGMNTLQKLGSIAHSAASRGISALKATHNPTTALQYAADPQNGLAGMLGDAFIGAQGVPVRIKLPPAAQPKSKS